VSAGGLLFGACSVLCLVGALWTVLSRNPIRSAVGLLGTIVGIAGLFLNLHAQFLAAIQLIVYAGAVVVLFVFVIMLLGPDAGADNPLPGRSRLARVVGAGLLLVSFGAGFVLLAVAQDGPRRLSPPSPEHGSVEAVGGLLFSDGIVAFELATALLIVAVIGAIAVARGRPRAALPAERPMFHGPIHPRDAGRPLGKEVS
jgi:NADH-quinone oxidoreductase subunit J